MKDFNFSDYLIPATFLVGPATTLYTYFRKEKTGDKDKDKLINENKKLKRNRLSNIVYGNLGYIASILAAYGYWQNRRSVNSRVASLKSMITSLQGENSDNSAKLERLQEDYLTLQARMQNEIVRSEALSNSITMNLMNDISRRTLRQAIGDGPALHVASALTDVYSNPNLGEVIMSVSTGTSSIDVYNSMQGKGIINKWLPTLGLIPIIALLSQQSGHFTNLLNEKFKGIHDSLSTVGTSIGLSSGDINRLVFDGQVYNNFVDFFQIINDKTAEQLLTTDFKNIEQGVRAGLLWKKGQVKERSAQNLNRFEDLKSIGDREADKFLRLQEKLKETYTTPPPNLDSMGLSMDPLYYTTPFMVPSEMRELADVNRSLRYLPPKISEDLNRSLIIKKKLRSGIPLSAFELPEGIKQIYTKEDLLGQEPDHSSILEGVNRLFSVFPGLIVADNFPQVTSPIRERAYYRNLKRFNKDEIFKGLSELQDDPL